MKTFLICLSAITSFFFTSAIEITGRWETIPSKNGNITGVVFKTDNSFEGYVNKKPFVSGTYTFNATNSILTMQDAGCAGLNGTYKVHFFSNADSMRFTVINDACTGRKEGIEKLVMGRVKHQII